MTALTKKYRLKARITRFISFVILLTPILISLYNGFKIGSVEEKFILSTTLIIAIILVFVNMMLKYRIRSTIWIVLLGVYVCLNNITVLLICIATATVIDEFILTPLYKSYKQKYIINKEIDKRG